MIFFKLLQDVEMANICTSMRKSSSWAVTCVVRWWTVRGVKVTRCSSAMACVYPTETPVLTQCSPLQVMYQHRYPKTFSWILVLILISLSDSVHPV